MERQDKHDNNSYTMVHRDDLSDIVRQKVSEIDSITHVFSPHSYPVRGGFDSYAVVFGDYPLHTRKLNMLSAELSDAFKTRVLLGEKSYQLAAVPPHKFPVNYSDNPNRKAANYRIPMGDESLERMFIAQVIPFKELKFPHSKYYNISDSIEAVHHAISELGMTDANTLVRPARVLGRPSTMQEAEIWDIIVEYCNIYSIDARVIKPDLSKYN
ncbi:MAG: hypothetical protein ACMXYL_05870 [Candidatus Woesearchaeota archaeon]